MGLNTRALCASLCTVPKLSERSVPRTVFHLKAVAYVSFFCLQDYPSLAQIARAIEANNINLVFAVTTDQLSIYEQLSANIKGSIAGRVAEDSSNVVELVKDQYMVRQANKNS